MNFFDWLADELKETDSEEIEIGFSPNTDMEEITERQSKET